MRWKVGVSRTEVGGKPSWDSSAGGSSGEAEGDLSEDSGGMKRVPWPSGILERRPPREREETAEGTLGDGAGMAAAAGAGRGRWGRA